MTADRPGPATAAARAALVVLSACGSEPTVWSVRVGPCGGPDGLARAASVEVEIEGPDGVQGDSFPARDGGGSIGLPAAGMHQIRLTARDGDTVVGRGGTRWHPVEEAGEACVCLGAVDTFRRASDADGEEAPLPAQWSASLGGLAGASATVLLDGRVLIAGGALLSTDGEIRGISDRAWIYDPDCGGFEEVGRMAHARAFHTATRLRFEDANGNGRSDPEDRQRILLVGGLSYLGGDTGERVEALRSGELFDYPRGRFELAGVLSDARYGHTATPLLNGAVLIAGGARVNPADTDTPLLEDLEIVPLASAEVYDPAGGTFVPIERAMAAPRVWHDAAPIGPPAEGRIAIVGGLGDGDIPLGSIEWFDFNSLRNAEPPYDGRFSLGPDPIDPPRWGHSATRVRAGGEDRVHVAGGRTDRGVTASARLVSADGTVANAPELGDARAGHLAVPLDADGSSVLVIGGSDEQGVTVTSAEVIHAEADSRFTDGCPGACAGEVAPGGTPAFARALHAAVPLLSGAVLIAGGATVEEDAITVLDKLEIYTPE